jgi:phosphonate transport system substrate-binding protein
VSRLARAATCGLAALTLLLAGCGGGTSDAASSTCPDGRIRFGVEPYEDPARLTPAYQVLADALSQRLACPVDLQVVEDYSAEVLAMQNGRLDVAQFGPLGYVFASERAHAEPVASFADASGALSTYTAGIWVPASSPITDIAGLRGRSLALSSAGSTSGDALPRKALADAGIAESDVRIDYAGGHPEALLALVNGTVDAAEINSQQLRSATDAGTFDAAGFRQIWTSEPIPNDPITVRGDLDPAVKAAVRDALLGLTPEQVAQVGALLDVSPPGPLVPVDRATYQPLFDLAATLGLTEEDV